MNKNLAFQKNKKNWSKFKNRYLINQKIKGWIQGFDQRITALFFIQKYNLLKSRILFNKNFAKIIHFFFPIFPASPFRVISYMVILAVLIAIRLVLGKFSIPLSSFGTRISLAWIPVFVIGWFYGPIYGFLFGWVTDSLSYLITGGTWYYLYALQEPTVALFSGIIGSLSRIFRNSEKIWIHLVIQQILFITFLSISYGYIIWWFNTQEPNFKINWFNQGLFVTSLVALSVFFLIFEAIVFYTYFKRRKILLTFLYASIIYTSMIFLWSFLLGPKIAIMYYQFLNNGRTPELINQYGPVVYLIPRILRETIFTPIRTSILTLVIFVLTPIFEKTYNQFKNSYYMNQISEFQPNLNLKLTSIDQDSGRQNPK
ncbi:putative membrane protein [Mycoplasmoides fastidiosum]|uniref:Membrane protein n=1 Tax=Mycoplasmoides fastidiosum TaxID=92758 RepID=A0ABU0LYM0_9BACT|nr:ECF transporter S component [Mycoplasmoides fastidiosum]MDQ0513774.1 putative membrane protein [Mycoplasmoides fastidiosum]UUD37808.1 ECF transporter S component [Mycoplasmoides fastidiosum]